MKQIGFFEDVFLAPIMNQFCIRGWKVVQFHQTFLWTEYRIAIAALVLWDLQSAVKQGKIWYAWNKFLKFAALDIYATVGLKKALF